MPPQPANRSSEVDGIQYAGDPSSYTPVALSRYVQLAAPVATKAAAYAASGVTDEVILADATAGAFTVTLPAASSGAGLRYIVVKKDASANVVTVGSAGGTINGAATQALGAQYAKLTVVSDGANWYQVA